MAMMRELGFHLHASHRDFLLLHNLNPNFHFNCSPISTYGRFLLLSPLPLHIRRCSRWNSNAEPYTTKNLNFDETEEFDDSVEQSEVLDEFIDSIWIFKKFQDRDKIKPKRRNKAKKRRPRSYRSRDVELEDAQELYGYQETRTQKKGYQSWVSNDGSTNDFGGWDELDTETGSVGSSRRTAQRLSRMKSKKKRPSARNGPLLLRLLVSVFPFLSSWTKVL